MHEISLVNFYRKPPGLNFQEYNQLLNHSKVIKKIYVGMNRRYFSSTINLKVKKLNGPRSIHIYDQQDTVAAKEVNQKLIKPDVCKFNSFN